MSSQGQEVLLTICPKSFLAQFKSISSRGEGKHLLITQSTYTLWKPVISPPLKWLGPL